jgi:hypothetical protein
VAVGVYVWVTNRALIDDFFIKFFIYAPESKFREGDEIRYFIFVYSLLSRMYNLKLLISRNKHNLSISVHLKK